MRYAKLLNVLYTVVYFFTSGVGVDDVMVRLSFIEQIIKDANLMCISFSVKRPQTFREPRTSLSNMSELFPICIYAFNPPLVMKT